jgi:hypothetical protein
VYKVASVHSNQQRCVLSRYARETCEQCVKMPMLGSKVSPGKKSHTTKIIMIDGLRVASSPLQLVHLQHEPDAAILRGTIGLGGLPSLTERRSRRHQRRRHTWSLSCHYPRSYSSIVSLYDSRLVLVQLVPGYHTVMVDLVDKLQCLSFCGSRDV